MSTKVDAWTAIVGLSVMGLLITVPTCAKCAGGIDEGYSRGHRTGTIVKFSQRGVWAKSWEGTMHLGAQNVATGSNSWDFSVIDAKAVEAVQKAYETGQQIDALYHEWWLRPWTLETTYVVDEVKDK